MIGQKTVPVESRQAVGRSRSVAEIFLVIAVLSLPTLALLVLKDALPAWFGSAVALLTLPTAALVAVLLARAGSRSWSDLGLGRPRSWSRSVVLGIGAGVGVLLVATLVVTPLVEAWVGPWLDPAMFDPLQGQVGALLVNVLLVSLLHAAVCEEIVFRGFLLQRMEHAFGGSGLALAAAVVLQAVLFGLAHFPQGAAGVVSTTVGGILWAGVFLWVRRELWTVIIGHAVMNTTLFVLVFLGQHRLLLSG